jgi:HEAT repeat protein
MLYKEEAEALKRSSWPRCDALAEALAAKGASSADALEQAASSRTHHVRTAALRALVTIDKGRAEALANRLLTDKAFEVREAAMKVLGIIPPPEVKRGYRLRHK